MKSIGYAKEMEKEDYDHYAQGLTIDNDILTYKPTLWANKQRKRNKRQSKYASQDPLGLTSDSGESDDPEPAPKVVPKKNKKTGKKTYSDEQKAVLVARLKAGREKAKLTRAKKKAEAKAPTAEKRVNVEIKEKLAPPSVKPKTQTKEPGLKDYLSAIERRWEARMSAVEKRHQEAMTAKETIPHKIANPPPAPTPKPLAPPPLPPALRLGRYRAANW